jgi:hypothetical protein
VRLLAFYGDPYVKPYVTLRDPKVKLLPIQPTTHPTDSTPRLHRWGVPLPRSRQLALVDPCLLAWLHEPQLLQRDEKELGSYSLVPLLARWAAAAAHTCCRLLLLQAVPYTMPT